MVNHNWKPLPDAYLGEENCPYCEWNRSLIDGVTPYYWRGDETQSTEPGCYSTLANHIVKMTQAIYGINI